MKRLSKELAVILGKTINADQDDVDIYAYSLEVLLGTVLEIALIILLAFLTNILTTTVICLAVFSSIRFFGGGVHCSTYLRCLVTANFLMLGLGKLATLPVSQGLLSSLLLAALLFSLYAVIEWVPAGTEKKVITDIPIRLKQKKKVGLLLVFWLGIAVIVMKNQINPAALAIALGILSSVFLISPVGYKTVKALEKFINNFVNCIRKEVKIDV